MIAVNDFPANVAELFEIGDATYSATTENGMDNVDSLSYFLDSIGASDDNYYDGGGTEVTLIFEGKMAVIQSYGGGTFYHHNFDVYILSVSQVRKIKLEEIEKKVSV